MKLHVFGHRAGELPEGTVIRPSPWRVNRASAAVLCALGYSMRTFGCYQPLVVRHVLHEMHRDVPDLEMIDGHARYEAAQQFGITDLTVINLGAVPDNAAKQLVLASQTKGSAVPLAYSKLVAEMETELGAETVARLAAYSITDVAAMCELIRVPNWVRNPDAEPTDDQQLLLIGG